MKLYEAQFSPELDAAERRDTLKTVIIASTPRCGSHMLGHSMMATEALGAPYEYCNPVNLSRWKELLGTRSAEETLRELMAHRTSANGVFSIKLHYDHLSELGGLDSALALFPDPHVVHIYRADILRQAISYSAALQTGEWIDGMPGNGRTAEYNHSEIAECLQRVATHNALWRLELKERGLPFMDVEFAVLLADTPGILHRIAALVDVTLDPGSLVETPPTKPQSDAGKSAALLRRFAADLSRGDQRRGAWRQLKNRLRAGSG